MLRRFALALLLPACAHTPPSTEPPAPARIAEPAPSEVTPAPAQDAGPWYGDVRALGAEAARVRGMELTQPFQISVLDDEPFLALFRKYASEQSEALNRELVRTFSAFIPVAIDAVVGANLVAEVQSAQADEIIAFYHFPSDQMVLRKKLPERIAAMGPEMALTLVAHELGHVLQDQLGVARFDAKTFDASITERAILEGDATLTATLLVGARKGLTPKRAVERSRIALAALTPAQLLALAGTSPKLVEGSPIVRELFVFPYLRGQRFIAELHQAGGLELVRAVLESPPAFSDAIFDAQRWLDGGRRPLAPLAADGGRLGAFLFRALLDQCASTRSTGIAHAANAEQLLAWFDAHYEDDVWKVDGGQLAWASTWGAPKTVAAPSLLSSPDAALASALSPSFAVETLLGCVGTDPKSYALERRDDLVGIAARGKPETRARAAKQTAAAKRLAATPAPFGSRPIPAASAEVAFRDAGGPIQKDGRWINERLGLTLTVPEGMQPFPAPGAALTLAGRGAILLGMFVDDAAGPQNLDATLNGFVAGLAQGANVTPSIPPLTMKHTWSAIDVGWAKGFTAKSVLPGAPISFHVETRVLPICDAKATVHLVAVAFAEESVALAASMLETVRGDSTTPPICAEP